MCDDRLTLVTVQSLEKARRDQNRGVVGRETQGNRIDRIRLDDTHRRRSNPRRHGHLTNHVHHLLLGEPSRIGRPRVEAPEERANARLA